MKNIVIMVLLVFLSTSCEKDPVPVPIPLSDTQWWNQVIGSANDFVIESTNEDYSSQTPSFKISKASTDSESYALWGQNRMGDLPLNKKLTLSAMIKCVNLAGKGAVIAIRCDGVNNTQLQFVTTQYTTVLNGTSGWKQYSITVDQVKPEVKNIIVYLIYQPNTTGTVYFDDIHLVYE